MICQLYDVVLDTLILLLKGEICGSFQRLKISLLVPVRLLRVSEIGVIIPGSAKGGCPDPT